MIRILHIEDVPHITTLIRQKCRDFQIDAVETLADAQKALREDGGQFDLLLIDLNLPDSMGMDTIRGLSSFGLPMVVLTGDPTDEFAREAAALGVADYIAKGEITRADLPIRIRFAHERFKRKHAVPSRRSTMSFTNFAALKPFLTCAVLA